MKYECSVVQDLMPGCIDGTASRESDSIVHEHMAECPVCTEVFVEMRKDLLVGKEKGSGFSGRLRSLRSQQRKRFLLLSLAMALLLVALAGGVMYLTMACVVETPAEDYSATRIDIQGSTQREFLIHGDGRQQVFCDFNSATGEMFLYMKRPIIPLPFGHTVFLAGLSGTVFWTEDGDMVWMEISAPEGQSLQDTVLEVYDVLTVPVTKVWKGLDRDELLWETTSP